MRFMHYHPGITCRSFLLHMFGMDRSVGPETTVQAGLQSKLLYPSVPGCHTCVASRSGVGPCVITRTLRNHDDMGLWLMQCGWFDGRLCLAPHLSWAPPGCSCGGLGGWLPAGAAPGAPPAQGTLQTGRGRPAAGSSHAAPGCTPAAHSRSPNNPLMHTRRNCSWPYGVRIMLMQMLGQCSRMLEAVCVQQKHIMIAYQQLNWPWYGWDAARTRVALASRTLAT